MKKGLGVVALAGVMAITGCSCSTEGVYKFDSIEIKVGDETKVYSCSTEDKEDSMIAGYCSYAEDAAYELKGDKFIAHSKYGKDGNETEEGYYKIEDGKMFIKENEDDEWMEESIAEVDGGKMIMGDENMKIIYKK